MSEKSEATKFKNESKQLEAESLKNWINQEIIQK